MVKNLVNDLEETRLAEEREREKELKWVYKVSDAEVIAVLGAIRTCTNFISVIEGLKFGIKRGYVLHTRPTDIARLQLMLEETKEQLDAHYKHLDIVKRNIDLVGRDAD